MQYNINKIRNKIIQGHVLDVLKDFPDESVDMVVTSPPYFNLRAYNTSPQIWGGDKNCKHQWGKTAKTLKHKSGETNPGKESWYKDKGASDDKGYQFCQKCGAFKGELGGEPTFKLYLENLLSITQELYRVMKPTASLYWVHGDSYNGSGKGSDSERLYAKRHTEFGKISDIRRHGKPTRLKNFQSKCLLMQSYRLAMRMCDEQGFILRNLICWYKKNVLPSSARNRFTVDWEPVFFFVKSNQPQYYVNTKMGLTTNKKPKGIQGIENKDWEWRDCPRCSVPQEGPNTGSENKEFYKGNNPHLMRITKKTDEICLKHGYNPEWKEKTTKIPKEIAEQMGSPRARYHRVNVKKDCKRCKGLGRVKYSLWESRDYYFEQQFEKSVDPESFTGRRPRNVGRMAEIDLKNYAMAGRIQKDGTLKGTGKTYPQRNKRTVWKVNTCGFPEAHFAVFPEKLISTPISASCPKEICSKCGLPREKIFAEKEGMKYTEEGNPEGKNRSKMKWNDSHPTKNPRFWSNPNIVGYTKCGCKEPNYKPGIVLDPFLGSGTTALVARSLRRDYIGIELSGAYIKIARKRLAQKILI